MPVAESVLAPPGPIPNPVVTQRSAGEYWGGDPLGGEAAAGTPHPLPEAARRPGRRPPQAARRSPRDPARGGAAAARWAHNPKVGGSNPPPATRRKCRHRQVPALLYLSKNIMRQFHPVSRVGAWTSGGIESSTLSATLPNLLLISSIRNDAPDAAGAGTGFALTAARHCLCSASHGAPDAVYRAPMPAASARRLPRT